MTKIFYFFVCIYNMSSGAERRIEKYSDKQTQTICVYRKFTDEDYAIWVKMIDLQKRSCHRNLKNTNGFMTIKVYTSVKILLID